MILPPAFAGRLLKRLVPAQDHDALLGDLCEEYQRRRSKVWYILQILAAIVVTSWRDIRTHKLVAIRAILAGTISMVVLVVALNQLQQIVTGAGFFWRGRWIGLPWYVHWPYQWRFWMAVRLGWVAGHATVGWIIVRSHRRHGLTMLLPFLGLSFLTPISLLLWQDITRGAFRPAFEMAVLISSAEIPLGLLAGGYLATRRPERA